MPPRQVLVIDDDPDSLRLTERMLRLDGYGVATAARPEFTPPQIAQLAPDLIVLNHWFAHEHHVVPFLQALRSDARTRRIPALLVTAAIEAVMDAQEELTDLDCTVLFKPFELHAFLMVVAQRVTAQAASPGAMGESADVGTSAF